MAQISRLMPYYGGEITDEEWENKVEITRQTTHEGDQIVCDTIYEFKKR